MSARTSPVWLAAVAVVGLGGCEEERPPLGAPVCVSWKAEIGPLLADQCVGCHAAGDAQGGAVLDDYLDALPVTRPRDDSAPIVDVFDADDTHRGLRSNRPIISRWVADCNAAFVSSAIHAATIMDPAEVGFHAELLRTTGYDFENCQRCHGDDYAGGGSEASCLSCHPQGPTDCSTCHGNEVRSGAHAAHEGAGALEKPSGCDSCHVVPDDALDAGHFRLARGEIDPPPAEVDFGPAALWGPPTLSPPVASSTATFDVATQTCANVYCHGAALSDAAAERPTPAWTETEDLDCASCHGAPPADHPGARCGDCHNAVSPGPDMLTDFAAHLDGRLTFAQGDGCDGCHGGPDGAPAPDLDGRTAATEVTVGAHGPHLRPRLGLSAPVECSECHLVPDTVLTPGHIDSDRPAEVFPIGAGRLARTDGADPQWDRTTATCSDGYCHGGGQTLGADGSDSKVRTLVWTEGQIGQVFCGSCHGIPPDSSIHVSLGPFELGDCATCHARTVDGFGNILFDGSITSHMDGVVDFVLPGDGS